MALEDTNTMAPIEYSDNGAENTARRARRTVMLNVEREEITILDRAIGQDALYALADYAPEVRTWLALQGLAKYLTLAESMPEAANKLTEGLASVTRTERRGRKSHWREAIALALMERAKKSKTTLTLDEARARAEEVSAKQLVVLKTDQLVLKHYNKLSGKNPAENGLDALI